jgi:hypothetical protein
MSGAFFESGTFIGFDCGDFEIEISGSDDDVHDLLRAASEGMGMERLPFLGDSVVGLTPSKTGYAAVLAVVPAKQVVVVFFVNDPDFN